MSTQEKTTYSMIAACFLSRAFKNKNITQSSFLKKCSFSQSSWSRVNRGISHLTLEEMRVACNILELNVASTLAHVDDIAERLPREEGIKILENLNAVDNKSIQSSIIPSAALAFLINRFVQKDFDID